MTWFNRSYRYKVSTKSLNSRMDKIYTLVCPEEEEGGDAFEARVGVYGDRHPHGFEHR